MTEDIKFYERVKKNDNFCGMTKATYTGVIEYINFLKEHPEISGGRFKNLVVKKRRDAKTIRLKFEDKLTEQDKRCIIRLCCEMMFAGGIGYEEILEELRISLVESQERFIKKEGYWE